MGYFKFNNSMRQYHPYLLFYGDLALNIQKRFTDQGRILRRIVNIFIQLRFFSPLILLS